MKGWRRKKGMALKELSPEWPLSPSFLYLSRLKGRGDGHGYKKVRGKGMGTK